MNALRGRPSVAMESNDLVDRWCAYQRVRGFADRTIDRRRWTLAKWVAFLDDRTVVDASVGEVELFLSGYSGAQTRYSMLADLRQFYRYLAQRGFVAQDPTTLVDPPRLPHRLPTPMEPAAVRRAIDGAVGDVRLMVMLAALAGLRCAEIAALEGRDVDLSTRVVVVRQGKGGRDRVVPLGDELAAALCGLPPGRVFTARSGQAVGCRVRRHLRSLGIRARPHDLRHSFATAVAQRADGNLIAVARLMGHASVTTTERYVHWAPETRGLVEGLFTISA